MKINEQATVFARPFMIALLATICCLLWGSAFPTIKLGYRWLDITEKATGTQILFAGYRFTLAGILTVVIGSILAGKVLLPKRESLKKIAVLYWSIVSAIAYTVWSLLLKYNDVSKVAVFGCILLCEIISTIYAGGEKQIVKQEQASQIATIENLC